MAKVFRIGNRPLDYGVSILLNPCGTLLVHFRRQSLAALAVGTQAHAIDDSGHFGAWTSGGIDGCQCTTE